MVLDVRIGRDGVEELSSRFTGTVSVIDYFTNSVIIESDSGEKYTLPFAWYNIDLQEHSKVTFKKYPWNPAYAYEVALDISEEVDSLIPDVKSTVATLTT